MRILDFYKRALSGFEHIEMNSTPENSRLAAWMPTVIFRDESGIDRDTLVKNMKSSGVDARLFFHPLSSTGLFTSLINSDYPNLNKNAYYLGSRGMNLPSYPYMPDYELNRVIKQIMDYAI